MKPEERDAFERWWRASKSCQVVMPVQAWEQIARDAWNAATAQSPAGVPPEPLCAAHSRIADRHAQCTCPIAPKCPFCGKQETRSVSVTERIVGTPAVATMPVRECNKCGQQWEDATTFSAKEAAVRAAGVPTTEPVAPAYKSEAIEALAEWLHKWPGGAPNEAWSALSEAKVEMELLVIDYQKAAAPQAPVEPVAQEPVAPDHTQLVARLLVCADNAGTPSQDWWWGMREYVATACRGAASALRASPISLPVEPTRD